MKTVSVLPFHYVLQGITPTLKYWPHSFLPTRLKMFENLTPHMKYDNSITTYFPFLKDNSQKNWMLCLHNACGIFRKFSWLYYLYLQI